MCQVNCETQIDDREEKVFLAARTAAERLNVSLSNVVAVTVCVLRLVANTGMWVVVMVVTSLVVLLWRARHDGQTTT